MCNEHRCDVKALAQLSFLRDCMTPSELLVPSELFPSHDCSWPLLHLPCSVCCFWLTYVCNFGAVVRMNKVILLKDRFSKLPSCGMWRSIVWHLSIGETSYCHDLCMFIIHQTARRNLPEDRNLHRHRSHDVKHHNTLSVVTLLCLRVVNCMTQRRLKNCRPC